MSQNFTNTFQKLYVLYVSAKFEYEFIHLLIIILL